LLVTDVILPGWSGVELVRQLQERLRDLKVLFLSGNAPEDLRQYGIATPGITFLQKPFRPAALVAKIRAVLDESPSAGR
jgi:DNA-binding response OmpR family regulator